MDWRKHTRVPADVLRFYSQRARVPQLDDCEQMALEILATRNHFEQAVEALREINQHLRDLVETQANGDINNWNGYYLPKFAALSRKYSAILAAIDKEGQ